MYNYLKMKPNNQKKYNIQCTWRYDLIIFFSLHNYKKYQKGICNCNNKTF